MPKFALLVTIRVRPGCEADFERHIKVAAAAAVREEPDCHQFQVDRLEDDPSTFVLYEVYTDADGLAHHHQQPHFLEFGRLSKDWIAEKHSQRLEILQP